MVLPEALPGAGAAHPEYRPRAHPAPACCTEFATATLRGGTVPASVRSRRSVERAGWRSWRVTVDQTLRCRECGVDFVWTAGEQEFYASRGLTNAPSRCPARRGARQDTPG